ncbi:MAG: 50S ribosomal protein L15 [Candidatus Sumerlaeota bacterium]|nr:50S ribosomal protein L15 [Candidatus Sumerlaeota bacterium]
MNLSDLPGDPGRKQKPKRLGRGEGSGRGRTAGRGNKGAKSRQGRAHGMAFEGGQMPYFRRIPKFGFHNPFRREYAVVNLAQLNEFEDGTEVTVEILYDKRLVRPKGAPVKILGNGDLKKKLTVRADAFSASAKEKIEAAGGSAIRTGP